MLGSFSRVLGAAAAIAFAAGPVLAQPATPAPPAPPEIAAEAQTRGESTEVILQKIEDGDTVSIGRVYVKSDGDRIRIERSGDSHLGRSIDIDVDAGDEGNEMVRFGEDITIEEGRTISGDVVSIGGSVKVMGEVIGDVVSVGGDVRVGPSGIVEGDAVSVGGRVIEEEGSQVRGSNVSVSVVPSWVFGPMVREGHVRHAVSFWTRVITAIVFIGLGWLIVTLMGRRMAAVCQYVRQRWGLSTAVGFLVVLLFLPAFVMLCITIIGIPIALLLPFALGLAILIGFVAASVRVGQFLFERAGRSTGSLARSMAGGMVFLLSLLLIAAIFHAIGRPLSYIAPLFKVVGWVGILVGSLSGLGAVVLSRLGSRWPPAEPPPAVPAAPMPAGPPVSPA